MSQTHEVLFYLCQSVDHMGTGLKSLPMFRYAKKLIARRQERLMKTNFSRSCDTNGLSLILKSDLNSESPRYSILQKQARWIAIPELKFLLFLWERIAGAWRHPRLETEPISCSACVRFYLTQLWPNSQFLLGICFVLLVNIHSSWTSELSLEQFMKAQMRPNTIVKIKI